MSFKCKNLHVFRALGISFELLRGLVRNDSGPRVAWGLLWALQKQCVEPNWGNRVKIKQNNHLNNWFSHQISLKWGLRPLQKGPGPPKFVPNSNLEIVPLNSAWKMLQNDIQHAGIEKKVIFRKFTVVAKRIGTFFWRSNWPKMYPGSIIPCWGHQGCSFYPLAILHELKSTPKYSNNFFFSIFGL